MPFPMIFGFPTDVPYEVVAQMRVNIVSDVAEIMKVPTSWVRPFLLTDEFDTPLSEADGAKTIYIRLDTGKFHYKSNDAVAKAVTAALAQRVFDALNGKYEVECFIGDLDPLLTCLIPAKAK